MDMFDEIIMDDAAYDERCERARQAAIQECRELGIAYEEDEE